MKLFKKLYWKHKRYIAETHIRTLEHNRSFITPFFLGSLYQRKLDRNTILLQSAQEKLRLADKKCKELEIK